MRKLLYVLFGIGKLDDNITRCFMVYYQATGDFAGWNTGYIGICFKGKAPFLNQVAVEEQIKKKNPQFTKIILTGFNELSQSDYDTFYEVLTPTDKAK